MTWIKICGTTNLDDALMSVEAGADALGFVFYENSPRHVRAEVVKDIVKELPETVEKIGVLPGYSPEQFREWVSSGLTGVQVHFPFSTSPEGSSHASAVDGLKKFYLSFSVTDLIGEGRCLNVNFSSFGKIPQGALPENPFGTVILESGSGPLPGGTGKVFDWNEAVPLVETMRESVKVVVAGGLNPGNVGEAIRILNPWGVDVVSGVESRPGEKDAEKVRAFIRAVRQADESK